MNALIKGYIGKDVLVYTGSSAIDGTLKRFEDSWIEVETSAGSQIINLDYISRIQEYPRNKKGKKSQLRALFG